MSDKQLSELNKASQKKKQQALEKTEQAILELISNNQKITVRSVARKAGVSVSYIYKYPQLSYKIQRLREEQKYSSVASDRADKTAIKQLEILQKENVELGREITKLKTTISEIKTGINSQEDFQTENIKLKTENQRLKRELEYTQRNLQEAREFILGQGVVEQDAEKTAKEIKIIQ